MNQDLEDAVAHAEVLAGELIDAQGERDRARDVAAKLEQECAHLREVLDGLLVWAEKQPGFVNPLALVPR